MAKKTPTKKVTIKRETWVKKGTFNLQPHWVCMACGITANYLTCLRRFGSPPLQPAFTVSTYHNRECQFCRKETMCTEARDFFYPDFSLIKDYADAHNQPSARAEPRSNSRAVVRGRDRSK